MSRTRFGLLLTALCAAVAAGAFAIGVALLDDDGPASPPGRAGTDASGDAATGTTGDAPDPTDEGGAGPTWVAVVSSEGSEPRAREVADEVAGAGLPSGVLRSDDHESLTPGFWVSYAGPYESAAEAESAVAALADAGFSGAYARCVGTNDQCG